MGRLSKNYLTRKFITWNSSRFMVYHNHDKLLYYTIRVSHLRKKQGVQYYEVEWEADGKVATLC